MTSKEIAIIPPDAILLEESSGKRERLINGFGMALASAPLTMFYGMDFALNGPLWTYTGAMMMVIIFAGSPFEVKGIPKLDNVIGSREEAKLALVKIPFIGKRINASIETTAGLDTNGKPIKRITVIRNGKSSVYGVDTTDPKDIWDKLYQKETGKSIESSIALNKETKIELAKLEAAKVSSAKQLESAHQKPEAPQSNSFLKRLIG